AVLVLHDDARRPVDVLGKMLGNQPPLDVGRATGRKVDDEVEALALVEGLLRACVVRHTGERERKRRNDDAHARLGHSDPPPVDRHKLMRPRCAGPAGLTIPGGHGTNGLSRVKGNRLCWKKAYCNVSTPTIRRMRICASSSGAPRKRARSYASRAPTGSS